MDPRAKPEDDRWDGAAPCNSAKDVAHCSHSEGGRQEPAETILQAPDGHPLNLIRVMPAKGLGRR
jgi:hypothetical protein